MATLMATENDEKGQKSLLVGKKAQSESTLQEQWIMMSFPQLNFLKFNFQRIRVCNLFRWPK